MKIPGNTELKKLSFSVNGVNFYAKVENSNPSGSIKDRAVYQILSDLKNDGKLNQDTIIVEATSGNTGIGLAYYSKPFGYKLIIYMPESMSEERRKMITSLGGELCLVKGGMSAAEEEAIKAVKANPNYILFDQFNNLGNVKAHYLTTGPEILKQCPKIDYLVAGIGTGGTITGIGKYLKEKKPDITVIGVEPKESPLLTKNEAHSHLIQGIGPDFVPSILDTKLLDAIIDVEGLKAIEMAKYIRNEEKIDVGISSGAALEGAIEYVKENNIHDKNIVVIFPDKGDRYQW